MIVGTAGHIDHGKTSLVKALTGVDTDRLKEEKARGITIELGFAYLPRPDGGVIGFVDVPGHERLVHTMLAGATGIDFVILAIAADDGVMPQTREHLAIIDLLGLTSGIIALTKCDLADSARRSDLAAQIKAALAGTGLADAAILPVSASSGEGISDLLAHLDRARATTARRAANGLFRLTVDRVFTLAGAGTVATGTVVSGSVAVGDQVMVSPAGVPARVRSIHAHNRAAERGVAGDRCALALAGPTISTGSVTRGAMLVDPAMHDPVRRIDARLTVLASERRAIKQGLPVRLHHGSAEVGARLSPLGTRGLEPGTQDFVQLVLDAPIACAAGDRFVLRDTSATRTIAGGVLLDLAPPERRRRTPARLAELAALCEPDARMALALVLSADRGLVDISAFFRMRARPATEAAAAVAALDLVRLQSGAVDMALLPATWEAFADGVIATLTDLHARQPELPGMGQEQLRLAVRPRLQAAIFVPALQRLQAQGRIAVERSWARLPAHVVRFSADEERLWRRLQPLLAGAERFRPPRVRDIARQERLDESTIRRLLKLAARRGDLDEIAPDHFFSGAAVIEMADIVRALARAAPDGSFAAAAFRDRLDNGRKVAIQILEFFDRHGLTMRRGDLRRLNPHKSELFSNPTGGS